MEIECAFEKIDWEMSISTVTVYVCKVTSCNITNRGTAVAAFKGDHKPQKKNDSVNALRFKDTKLHYIPQNLTQFFPNLAYLAIQNCELKEVTAEDLIGLENLEDFDIRNNHITTLPDDLFKNMKKLKEVDFNGNLIQHFDAKILEPIKDTIEVFRIYDNPGIDEYFNKKKGSLKDSIKHLEMLQFNEFNSKRFGDLFSSGNHSDFTIKVQNKEYKVIKGILASMSSVFDKMFTDDPGAASKTFDNIENFSEDAIEEFLRYFYSRDAPSDENVNELLKLAVEFGVPDLKLQCEATLVDTIKPESAQQLYNLAVKKSLPKLKRKAVEAIQESHPEIPDYAYDRPQLVNQLIEAKQVSQAKKIKLEKEE